MIRRKQKAYRVLSLHSLGKSACSFHCMFYRLIYLQGCKLRSVSKMRKLCLTAKTLRRMTGFCSSALTPCVTLGLRSRLDFTDYIHVIVPSATMQSCKTSILYVLDNCSRRCSTFYTYVVVYIIMRGFLVGATEPEKRTLTMPCLINHIRYNIPFLINNSRYKQIQLRYPG